MKGTENRRRGLWTGRFEGNSSMAFDEFNASIHLDLYLAEADIKGSRAHAKGLLQIGIFTQDQWDQVDSGLGAILEDIQGGSETPSLALGDEDVHMWIERLLTDRLGDLGKKVHTGRSRNDQVATAMKVWLTETIQHQQGALKGLMQGLLAQATSHQASPMPGYTHLQPAQPITLGFHLLTYIAMHQRDALKGDQLLESLSTCPLGSGALCGSNYPLPRFDTAEALGFKGPVWHAMDGVSDRDYVVDYLYWVSGIMGHMSRLAEELILWTNPCFGFVTLADALTSGSSMMPQKKNPDGCELIRGKAATAIGRLTAMQGVLKGLPLAYNKDLQEDKALVYHAAQDLSASLGLMTEMIRTATFHPGPMEGALALGYVNATDLADWLVDQGIPFRDAHHMAGRLVQVAMGEGLGLEGLSNTALQSCLAPLGPLALTASSLEELRAAISPKACLDKKTSYGSTHLQEVKAMCENLHKMLY